MKRSNIVLYLLSQSIVPSVDLNLKYGFILYLSGDFLCFPHINSTIWEIFLTGAPVTVVT